MYKRLILLLLLFMLNLLCAKNSGIINTNVERTINIKSQLVKIHAITTIINLNPYPIKSLIYTIDPDVDNFYVIFKDEENKRLMCNETEKKKHFEVFFNHTLLYNSTFIVKSESVYMDKIVPLYKKLTFDQNQFVSYKGNLLYYSPYKTLKLQTIYLVKIDEDSLLSHTPNNFQNSNMVFINKSTLNQYSFEQIEIEFKNNRQFLVVHKLERSIDVSHFGKIFVEDKVEVKNEGSKLVGPYIRRKSNIVEASNIWWYMHLPSTAHDIKYFDSLGNNSKSILLNSKLYKTFKFQARYPLLNGWKTSYVVQYSVPAYQYLYYDLKDCFILKMRLVDHILTNVIIRNASIKVLLPEAAEILKASIPYGFERLEDEKHYTALSTFGRPTLSFIGSNILENHIASFTAEYLFPVHYLIRVPLMIILYLESVFVFLIIVVHLK